MRLLLRLMYLPLPMIHLRVFKEEGQAVGKEKEVKNSRAKMLRKVGLASRVESSNDVSLGAQVDASKQGREIADLDADAELVDETQGGNDKDLMFDTGVFEEPVSAAITTSSIPVSAVDLVTTAGEVVTTELARKLEAKMQVELVEEERIVRQREEEANMISWDNTQAMIEADFELAQRLQAEEQGKITIDKDQDYFYDEIQKLFDKEMKRMNTFMDMDSEVVKGSETRTEESSKRAGDELESDKSKKQKVDEHVEAKKDNDLKEEEMKKHMEIVQDDEVAIDAIPLATKPPMIVEYKIAKEGNIGYF
nr:hypothetical protein [Tanacetum cinerariifolium]